MTIETPAAVSATEPTAGPGAVANRIRSQRADTLAALISEGDAPAEKAETPEVAKAPAVEAEPDAHDDDEADDEPAPAAKAPEAKVDSETSKRLAAVQAAEKRSRDKVAAERAEVVADRAAAAKERAELAAERAEIAEYRKARERAKLDPVAYLKAAGVTDPAELEYAAKQAYAAGKGEPANKEAAARALREREHSEEVAALRKRLDARDAEDAERSERATIDREVTTYVDGLKAAVGTSDVSPLAKHFMNKSPAKTEATLRRLTYELAQETGDKPDFDDVLARYEQTRRAELEELGVDPASLTATSKKPEPEATKKTVAKTLGNDLSTPRVPRPKSSEREHRAETRRLLELGKLE